MRTRSGTPRCANKGRAPNSASTRRNGHRIGVTQPRTCASVNVSTSGAAPLPAVSRFFGVSISWLFIVSGGHLLVIAAVVQSFSAFPVASAEPFAFLRAVEPQRWGAEIFSLGLWIALPLVAMLLFTNLVLGVISRVAQQMNVFAIGFPITLGVGLIGVLLTLPLMEMPFTMALERMLAHFQ